MNEQLQITFSPQNSSSNQAILDANRERLSNQCQIVLGALLSGERLTTASALINYGVGDLRARIRDILHSGIEVSKKLEDGRFKVYYMTYEQINQFKKRA